jgi:hypothetical protein
MEPISTVLALAQFAPQLVKWITGSDKAAEVAEVAVDVAKQVTGRESTEGAIAALKAADPNLVLQYQQAIEDRTADLEKAFLADLDSARRMQAAALQQDDVFAKRFVYYFAAGWSGFSMLFFALTAFLPVKNARVVDTVLGFLLGTAIASIFQFFYGSSARSARKDEVIQSLTRGKQ